MSDSIDFDFRFDKSKKAPLFHQYPGQLQPQPAHIQLAPESRTVSADWSGEIGGYTIPTRVWNDLELRFAVPANVRGDALVEFCEQHDELFARICDGFREEWNGSDLVGKYNDDALAAIDEIKRLIEAEMSDELVDVTTIAGFYAESSLSEIWPDGKTLDEAATALAELAKTEAPDEVEVLGDEDDAREFILEICDRERGNLPARLKPELQALEDADFDDEDFLVRLTNDDDE